MGHVVGAPSSSIEGPLPSRRVMSELSRGTLHGRGVAEILGPPLALVMCCPVESRSTFRKIRWSGSVCQEWPWLGLLD